MTPAQKKQKRPLPTHPPPAKVESDTSHFPSQEFSTPRRHHQTTNTSKPHLTARPGITPVTLCMKHRSATPALRRRHGIRNKCGWESRNFRALWPPIMRRRSSRFRLSHVLRTYDFFFSRSFHIPAIRLKLLRSIYRASYGRRLEGESIGAYAVPECSEWWMGLEESSIQSPTIATAAAVHVVVRSPNTVISLPPLACSLACFACLLACMWLLSWHAVRIAYTTCTA